MTATVIRHKLTPDGFAVVVTTFLPSFAARYQRYVLYSEGQTSLAEEHVYSNEVDAIKLYEDCHGS